MRKLTFLFALLCASMMIWADTQYCETPIADGKILYTCAQVDATTYTVILAGTSTATITGCNNCNWGINDINGVAGGSALSFDYSSAGYGSLTATFTCATTPNKPYVAYSAIATSAGQIEINECPKDMDWTVTCSGGGSTPTPDPDPTPVGIDWSSIAWLGNGSGNAAYTDKYKISLGDPAPSNVVNIQTPGWPVSIAGPGIYVEYPSAAFGDCSIADDKMLKYGAGVLYYMSAFTAQETVVSMEVDGTVRTFTVYYADGEPADLTGWNIAKGKTSVAGHNSEGGHAAANDGNTGTRWSSNGAQHYAAVGDAAEDWWYVDLGNFYTINTIKILFETACPTDYDILTSNNGGSWTVIGTYTEAPKTGNDPATDYNEYNFTDKVGRYVKIFARNGYNNFAYGFSMYEFEVYGEHATLEDHNPPTMTSATLSGDAEWNQVHLAVAGTDPEDGTVVSFHVVDATNSIDQVCIATAGIITVTGLSGETVYALSVTAMDNAGNESANAIVVNVTTPIDTSVPLVAAPVPDGTGKDVLPIYSDAFPSILAHSFDKDGFAGVTLMEEKNISGDNCLVYNIASANEVTWGMYDDGGNAIIAADGYHSASGKGVDASAMTYLHIDIWSLQTCTNSINICINDAALTSLRLSHNGSGWQGYDIALSDFNEGAEGKKIDNVRWFKFNGIGSISGKMALDNVYFWAPASGMKSVSATSSNSTMGSAVVKQGDNEVTSVVENSSVTFIATVLDPTLYTFVNWTNAGMEVSTDATYVVEHVTEATNLIANFDYIRTTYCHTAVQTTGNKKVYLTVGKGTTSGTYQIKIEGSDELTITGINLANTAMNNIKYDTYDGNDVPLTVANGGWTFSDAGYGSITSAEIQPRTNYTWRDMWMWRPDLFIGTSAGEQNINDILSLQHHFNWDNTCSDATAPVFAKAEGAVLDATSVRLTIQATDNWEGVLTYTIARAGAEPIISNHASGEEFTQDVTGLTTGTEYDFTVTVSDGVNNANTHILVTPVGDETKPVMGTASLESKTWNSAIINVAATDNIGVVSFYIVELDQDFVASEGKITVTGLTQGIAYSFTIKAKDGAGNLSENSASVNFTTDAHLTAPATAAPVPTWPAAQVKSLYSDSYSLAPSAIPNYNDCWWDCPNANEGDVEGNNYMLYDLYRNGMIGVSFANISVATMEKIHIDIWSSAAGSVTFRPITGGSEIRQTLNLAAQQWNSFDLDMADFTGQDWANLYQYAIENYQAGGLVGEHICVDNVFFYRETALTDAEAPTNLSVDVTQENFSSVKLTVSAEDNSGAVNFSIKNGDTEVASGAAAAGVATIISVKDLTPGTNYVFKVIAKDDADNAIEQDGVAVTTLVLPGAATSPTQNSALVKSLYSDAYTPIVNVENYCEWWWQSPTVHPTTLSANEHVLFYDNLNNGASFGWSWNVGNKIDFTGFQKLHLHIYPSQSGTIEIYPVIAPEAEFHKVSQTLTAGQWNDIVLDYTDKTFAPLNQIGFVNFFNLGEFFIDNVYFYAEVPAKDVVRDGLSAGKWGTICPKQTVENVEGATFYQISYLEEQNGLPYNMVWDQISGTTLTAGQPYFFIADGTQILGNKTGAELTVASDGVNGFYGYISSTDATMELTNWHTDYDANEEYNTFIIYNNSVFRINQGGTMLNSERCYININSTEPSRGVVAPAPGLKRLNMSISGTNETTDIDALKVSDKPVKMIIDGQLYILRGEKLYDSTGRMVK